MPAPTRTSLEEIVAAGRGLLEEGGPDAVTMQAVAQRVGVRAPSLYKRVRDRDALVGLVAAATVDDLAARLAAGGRLARRPRPRLPGLRAGAAGGLPPAAVDRRRPRRPWSARAPRCCGPRPPWSGPAQALDAARLVTAWVTGFVSMELAGAFRLGGDLEGAFEFGLAG